MPRNNAPKRVHLRICPNCGRRIDFEADHCKWCNAYKSNGWKPIEETEAAPSEQEPEIGCEPFEIAEEYKVIDVENGAQLHVTVTSAGGYFNSGMEVELFAKDGCISLKSGNMRKFVNLKKDFFLCSRRKAAAGKVITLVFSEFLVNIKDDSAAEQAVAYIYGAVCDLAFEKHDCFYNVTHELFPV